MNNNGADSRVGDKRGSNLRNSGNVGFQTPGLNDGFNVSMKKLTNKKQDRYATLDKVENLHSEIAEEDLNKYINNSPLQPPKQLMKVGDSMDDVNTIAKEGLILQNYETQHIVKRSPHFGDNEKSKKSIAALQKQQELPPQIHISKISQEDIQNRKTVEEIFDNEVPSPSIAKDSQKDLKIKEKSLKLSAIGSNPGTQPGTARQDKPMPNTQDMETIRLQKLENMKEYVQFKKVMEYESETIELYEMISEEFDYEELRKESPHFSIKQYKDSIYRGEINKKRKREGKGVIVYDTGRIYEGTWESDKRGGRGYELFSNGNTYQGEYCNGKAHGKGAYIWRNGEVYDGEWDNGQKSGYGVWKGIHGDSYIGQWKDSKAEGYGVHIWLDGDRYEGEWSKCLRHGNGTDFFANGDHYTGQYTNGKPEGFGQYKWANGNSYTGEFKLGQKHGKGKWKKRPSNPDDKNRCNNYDGYYEMDRKHGFGTFQWESGNKYIGNYHYDERQGYGTMNWTDGSKFTGHWIKGVQEGIGIMVFPDGSKRAGFFENNVYSLPLQNKSQLQELQMDMPEEILEELLAYLDERNEKINQMKDDGQEVLSQMLESEQNFMGYEFKPKVEYEEPSEDENASKMKQVKGMQEVGKQTTSENKEPYINHEGLKRVYKPRAEREAESKLIEEEQKQMEEQKQGSATRESPFLTDIQNNPISIFNNQGENQTQEDSIQSHVNLLLPQNNTVRNNLQNITSPQNNTVITSPQNRTNPHQRPPRPLVSVRDKSKEMDCQTELDMNKINTYDFDRMKDPNFGKRKVSKNIEIQTDLKMNTINKYEQSMVETGPASSDKNEKLSLPILNNGDKNSDFGQVQEFPHKKRMNVLDQSLTFTEDNNITKPNLQKGQNKYTSEISITGEDLNYTKNNENTKKSKMIQTIQINNKEKERFFSRNRNEEVRSTPGSKPPTLRKGIQTDEYPRPYQPSQNSREKPTITPNNASKLDQESKLPSIIGANSRLSGTGNFNKRFQQAAKTHGREKFVVSSQIKSEDEESSTPIGSSLAYNEFELLPRMRETYHPRPDFTELYAQNRQQNYMSDNNNYGGGGTQSGEQSTHLINYPDLVNENNMNMNMNNHSMVINEIKPKLKKKKVKKGKKVQKSLFTNQSPIRIGGDSTKRNGSVQDRAPLTGIRIAPTYFSSNLHSTSNRMANIYRQPIGAGLRKKSKQIGSHNFQSISTNDQTNQILASLNQNALQADNEDLQPINSIGLHSLKKKKIPMDQKRDSSISIEDNIQNSPRSPNLQIPLPTIPLQNIKYHQNNNSIQAIEINREELQTIASVGNSPTNEKSKKKRKKVWIPAASLRRVGLNAAANLIV